MQPHSSPGLPSVKLVLGYEGSGDVKKEQKERKCGFTKAQWHELYLQAVIFKYIQCGLPVPLHLVLPIFRSASSFFSSDSSEFFRQISGFKNLNAWGPDDTRMMDPEPERCRRTDGKKWRCSKGVVPHQKYCERHMHRGSNRSRKLVEASQSKSESEISPASKYHRTSINMPSNLEPKFFSSNATNNASAAAKASNEPLEANHFCTKNSKPNSSSFNGVSTNLVSTTIPPPADCTNQTREERNTCQSYVFVPGLGISPKNGLEYGTGRISAKEVEEAELLRCRRSDGKKWRCKRASVPEFKYCELHLHRGSKKITTAASNPVTVAMPPPSSMDRIVCPPPLAIPTTYIDDDDGYGANLNTNLSIATPASLQQVKCGSSTHTSSSDSTTITDETPAFGLH